MNTQSNLFRDQHVGDTANFSAPLGAAKRGRLEIRRGISNLDLRGDPEMKELFQGKFAGLIPDVRTQHERLIIHYPLSLTEWLQHLFLADRQTANVTLNTSIPWEIDIHGGATRIDADLRALQLRSLVITSGVAETNILLPRPFGKVTIEMASGVSNVRIFRPDGVPVRLNVGGGASQLTFDDRFYNSIGGGIRLDTSNYKSETNCYDISIHGGVSNLVLRTQA